MFGEIAKATDWQNHSIRRFISGTPGKKMGLTVESSQNDAGERTYRLAKQALHTPLQTSRLETGGVSRFKSYA